MSVCVCVIPCWLSGSTYPSCSLALLPREPGDIGLVGKGRNFARELNH